MSTSISLVSLASFLFILLPTFSSISCPSKLPCNSTIEIRPPFFIDTPGLDPACRKSINVSCGDFGPELDLVPHSKLLLKDISYSDRTILVQDVELSVLKGLLPCTIVFSFMPSISDFRSSYSDLERWLSSITCSSNNLTLFHSMFGDDKDVESKIKPDERNPASCPASPLFEWTLHFGVNGGVGQTTQVNFSVLSASISKDLASSTGCISSSTEDGDHGKKSDIRLIIAASVSAISGLLLACLLAVLKVLWNKSFIFLRKNRETKENIELVLSRYGIRPKRYMYSELKKITWSFSEKLGKGGYGTVFKGALRDGRLVAVKLLHNSRGDGEEFVNKVVSIVNTSHVNIVCLLGFCLEGSTRGLVYEYMPNGSLERYIYSENPKSVTSSKTNGP